MGRHGLSTLLELADLSGYIDHPPASTLDRQFDFVALAAINIALEEMYGERGGRGMALRVGRAAFAQGIKQFGAMKAVAAPPFRALPLDKQLIYGLNGLASILTNFTDQKSWVEPDGTNLNFTSEVSPFAWGRESDRPVCHMMVGLLQESLRWASNGYEFYVREVDCIATGSRHCVFRVNRIAIGGHNTSQK